MPVHDKKIGDQAAVNHRFTQPRDGVDDDSRMMTVPRIGRIHHPRSLGLDHNHTPHTHNDIFIQESFVEAVGHGRNRIFAGQDFFIGQDQIIGADIEEGTVLPGKGGLLGIFSQGAAAHGNTGTLPRFID